MACIRFVPLFSHPLFCKTEKSSKRQALIFFIHENCSDCGGCLTKPPNNNDYPFMSSNPKKGLIPTEKLLADDLCDNLNALIQLLISLKMSLGKTIAPVFITINFRLQK